MWWPYLLTDRDEMSNLHRGHSIDDSYQVSVVAMFVNRSGRNEQSSLRTFHRCFLPSFGSCLFYTLQVGIHILIFFLANLAKGNMSFCHHLVSVVCHPFTFHILIWNKNCLWRSCLLTDRNKMTNFYRGPSIDASYQVSVHLVKRFQRRRLKCEK
jgi:hypothetical protein